MEKKENIFDILEELVAEVKSRQWDTEEDVWGAEAKLIDEYSEKIELKLSEAREEGRMEMKNEILELEDIDVNQEGDMEKKGCVLVSAIESLTNQKKDI